MEIFHWSYVSEIFAIIRDAKKGARKRKKLQKHQNCRNEQRKQSLSEQAHL